MRREGHCRDINQGGGQLSKRTDQDTQMIKKGSTEEGLMGEEKSIKQGSQLKDVDQESEQCRES